MADKDDFYSFTAWDRKAIHIDSRDDFCVPWITNYDGFLTDDRELLPRTVYACRECGFAWLTRETGRWKFGTIQHKGSIDGPFYFSSMGLILVCIDERGCMRRQLSIGNAQRQK